MSEPVSITNGIAGRYANALFDLALEGKGGLKGLKGDIAALQSALDDSDAFRDLIDNPVYGRAAAQQAIAALAKPMGLSEPTANTLKLMAGKGRLFAVPAVLDALRGKVQEHEGEVTAEVTSAKPLSKDQSKALAAALKKQIGREVSITTTVDESLIGGLIVKVGSKMIDTSVASKLAALKSNMKEVG